MSLSSQLSHTACRFTAAALAGIEDEAAVAAAVLVAFGAVQRLVDVAHEVHDELQRLDALVARRGSCRRGSSICVSMASMTLLPLRPSRFSSNLSAVDGDVHVVPGRGVLPLAADLIGPACDFGVGDVHVLPEQVGDAGLGRAV